MAKLPGDEMWKCCPDGAVVNLDELRRGEMASVWCIRCGRTFSGPRSAIRPNSMGIMALRPGDMYVEPTPAK